MISEAQPIVARVYAPLVIGRFVTRIWSEVSRVERSPQRINTLDFSALEKGYIRLERSAAHVLVA